MISESHDIKNLNLTSQNTASLKTTNETTQHTTDSSPELCQNEAISGDVEKAAEHESSIQQTVEESDSDTDESSETSSMCDAGLVLNSNIPEDIVHDVNKRRTMGTIS